MLISNYLALALFQLDWTELNSIRLDWTGLMKWCDRVMK